MISPGQVKKSNPELYDKIFKAVKRYWEILHEEGLDNSTFPSPRNQRPAAHCHLIDGVFQFYGTYPSVELVSRAFQEVDAEDILQVHLMEAK